MAKIYIEDSRGMADFTIYEESSRIVNVETGEIEKTEVYDHIGDIGQLLTNGMREVAIGLIQWNPSGLNKEKQICMGIIDERF